MPGRKSSFSSLITAEHASAVVPERWRYLFTHSPSVLASHRAWDAGSRDLAQALSHAMQAPLIEGRVSRLLVDLNRSLSHPGVFSEFSRGLPDDERQWLIENYWRPHWRAYRDNLEAARKTVLHLACHSFTPVLNGQVRQADIGLLYDPSRSGEQAFCRQLKAAIQARLPDLRVRMNYPYRGVANGLGQQHRRFFDQTRLMSIELEVNNALFAQNSGAMLIDHLVDAVRQAAGCR
ncbi:MAG: N-formylglutamate amidohydrolase [Wenzhouxiangella sp.]